ncbi:MAG: hypothetical protein QOI20_3434 [Acidimicrobiaceae bacterium]|nr:hypothetical protein [Acidimicrobiaceae bacterium]
MIICSMSDTAHCYLSDGHEIVMNHRPAKLWKVHTKSRVAFMNSDVLQDFVVLCTTLSFASEDLE